MTDAAAPALAPTSSSDASGANPSARWILGLLAIALPLLLFRLGAKDVWEASEGRPIESAREMRAHGDWLIQYTNGERDLTKPPLYAWLVGVAFAVGGENEFAGRVPSVLASIGVLLAVFALGRRIAGPRAGFLSALLLLTTAKFLWQARLAELETLLALGVMWAYVSFDSAVTIASDGTQSPSALRSWLPFGLWLGLAAAVKGPIAFLLVLPGAIGYAIHARRLRAVRSLGFSLAMLVALAIGAAWPAAVVLRDGQQSLDTLLSFAKGENVGHLHDPFYYLAQYPLYALPWTPLVLLAMRLRWARDLSEPENRRARLPLIAFAVTFIAQSTLAAKQTHYLIPTVFPMGTVLAGCWAESWMRRSALPTPFGEFLAAGSVLVAIVIGALGFVDGLPVLPILLFAGAGAIALAMLVFADLPRGRIAECVLLFVLLVAAFAEGWVVPLLNHRQSSRAFLEAVDARVPKSASLSWTIFGSHSDYLWYLSAERVGTSGIRELVGETELQTILRVRAALEDGDSVIVTGQQAAGALDVGVPVLRDDDFQRKGRDIILLRPKEPK